MSIANVTLNNTFDEWRTATNQLITFVNEVDTQQLINAASNSAVLTVSPNKIFRNETLYLTLNVSSDILDTSTLNVATINAVSFVYSDLTSRIDVVYDEANTINAVANAAIIQSNVARVHANTAHASANAGLLQANTARSHANTAHASANAGLLQANTARDHANISFEQANTARVHANVSFEQANTARVHANTAHSSANAGLTQANTAFDKANSAYDLAVALSGNTVPTLEANKAAFDNSNSAFLQANTARVHANTGHVSANAAFDQANTARIHANTAHVTANAGLLQANTARDHANAAFLAANNVAPQIAPTFLQANTARDHANTSHASANAGLLQANTARDHANAAFLAANNAVTDFSPAFIQANTARDHANAAFLAANNVAPQIAPTFVQANTARDHANASFARANIGFSNTSGSSFVGNMQIPTGNLSIGEGSQQGVRLHVNSWIGVANVWPQVEIMGGAQFIQFNANTNFGGWNDLMLDRDLSIIYSRGTSDDGANLMIGPWTDSSFGYKQDGAGRHGFNTSNPRQVLDANGSANISGSLLVWNTRNDTPMNVVATITSAFVKANTINTLGTQFANSVSITGGSITGITDLTLADGGTNASLTASAGAVVYSTASAFALSGVGTSGQVLTSGATGAPTWTAQSSLAVGTFTSTSQNSQFNSLGVGTAGSGVAGEIRATNEITAYYSSDINLKTNITPIENALDKIRQISGVMFDWKDEEIERRGGEDGYFVRKHDTGIIAQEVEAVLPEVVATREDGYKAVKYEKLAGLIIQAINELATEIDKLKI